MQTIAVPKSGSRAISPSGSNAIGPGDSLFGSFVGLFVARIGDADRKLSFRTQGFLPPAEAPPCDRSRGQRSMTVAVCL